MNFKRVLSVVLIGGTILSFSTVAFAGVKANSTGNTTTKTQRSVTGKMFKAGARDDFAKGVSDTNLSALVTAGILTQAEADKITALAKVEAETHQAEMDKVKNMTTDERKAYFEAKKSQTAQEKIDIFSKAVAGGIITQEKADAAKAKLKENKTIERTEKLNTSLKELVTAGTITQAQADKVVTFINNMKNNKPEVDNRTTKPAKGERKNPLAALVEDGTLTQAQLDAICKVLPFGKGHGHGR